ncbi:MAG: histidine kinase [Bacillota bacterium]
MRTATLQSRLMVMLCLIVVLLLSFSLLTLTHAHTTAATYQGRLSDLVRVTELTRAVDNMAVLLGQLATGSSPERADQDFRTTQEEIYRLRRELPTATVSPAAARMVLDLDAIADSFMVEAAAALYALRDGDLNRYFLHDRQAAVIAGHLRNTADRMLAAELEAYRQAFPEVDRRYRYLKNTNLVVMGTGALLVLLFGWAFARQISDSLRDLAHAARRIAGGDLYGPAVPAGQGEEMQVLSGAFNQMQEGLRQHMRQLEEKVELERRLKAEELENLQVHTLLREAELRALQFQVNPHFLFNTLNTLAKTALIEGADRTCTLLETVSGLLRYSLGKLDQPVTLAEEIAQVRRYATIQAERFRDRLRLLIDLDESTLNTPIPCLTLQPLVENAMIHGIGGRVRGGTVWLTARRLDSRVRIVVRDDGVGMPQDRLVAVLERDGPVPTGHTTGLGLFNVSQRLRLFGDGTATLSIESRSGEGTTVTIELPAAPEGEESGANPGGR